MLVLEAIGMRRNYGGLAAAVLRREDRIARAVPGHDRIATVLHVIELASIPDGAFGIRRVGVEHANGLTGDGGRDERTGEEAEQSFHVRAASAPVAVA